MSEPVTSQLIPDMGSNTQQINATPANDSGATVSEPKAPEVKATEPSGKSDDSKSDFNDFLDLIGERSNDEGEKNDTTLQAKPNEPATPPPETKDKEPEQQTQQPVQSKDKVVQSVVEEEVEDKTNKRDYSDVEPEVVPLLKKMGGKSFDYFKAQHKEHKSLKAQHDALKVEHERIKKGALPENYVEHPHGYTLSKEFEALNDQYGKAQQLTNHWQQQLEKINNGEETYTEVYVDQSGELRLSKPTIATKETIADLSRYVAACQQQASLIAAKVETMGEAHLQKHKEAVGTLKGWESEAFKMFTGEEGKKLEPILRDTISKIFPPAFQKNPLAEGYAKAIIVVTQLGNLVKQLKAAGTNGTATTTTGAPSNTDKTKANPNNSTMSGGGVGSAKAEVGDDINDFNEVMGRRY